MDAESNGHACTVLSKIHFSNQKVLDLGKRECRSQTLSQQVARSYWTSAVNTFFHKCFAINKIGLMRFLAGGAQTEPFAIPRRQRMDLNRTKVGSVKNGDSALRLLNLTVEIELVTKEAVVSYSVQFCKDTTTSIPSIL